MSKDRGLDDFPREVASVIEDGKKHGIKDDLMTKGMVSIGNMMSKFVKPDSPEEALVKEMWQEATDEEKSMMADLVLRMGKKKMDS